MGIVTTFKGHIKPFLWGDRYTKECKLKYTCGKEFCMNFKKYNEMELALIAAIANMTTEDVEDIKVENGDIDSITVEDCFAIPSYIHKPDASHHAQRRKATFKKKVERKNLARQVGYDMSTENSKKVRDLLSANHSDRRYFRGSKKNQKYMSVEEGMALMEQEAVEKAMEAMMEEHDSILGSIGQDIEDLNMDMRCIENDISSAEKELEEAKKKLQNAKMQRRAVLAALLQKKSEYEKMCDILNQEMRSRFGW